MGSGALAGVAEPVEGGSFVVRDFPEELSFLRFPPRADEEEEDEEVGPWSFSLAASLPLRFRTLPPCVRRRRTRR